MRTVRTIDAVRDQVAQWRKRGLSVGFVPTMGALHAGHVALIYRSRQMCDRTVVSIFVNPTQFGPNEDFAKYPRAWDADQDMCEDAGVDMIFAPGVNVMYPDGFATTLQVGELGRFWEGASRPGHFDGVATIVAKLFTIVGPDLAIFGQKDYQQTIVIRRMVKDLNLPVRVVVAPTVREPGGLAMSSRNAYLDMPTRIDAQSIYRSLKWSGKQIRTGVRSVDRLTRTMTKMVEAGRRFKIDYIGFCDRETLEPKKSADAPLVILIAARCLVKGSAFNRRYIDNLVIR
jgi:pantoate--beta-alanine ligase